MANMNALFRKGYLLAGVMMATNMFAVNEMRAMKEKYIEQEGNEEDNDKDASSLESVLNFVLSRENTINLIGGTVSSVANNYLKLWDYNAGGYLNLRIGCLGWRFKRLLNDIFQFDINLNIGRGCFWAILSAIGIFCECVDKNKKSPKTVAMYVVQNVKTEVGKTYFFITFLQELISAPLTVHIAKFDFSISLSIDSIIWEIVRQVCWKKHPSEKKKDKENLKDLGESNIILPDRRQTNGGQ